MRRKRPWKWKGGLSNSTAFSCSFVLRKVCWLRPIRMINILHAITVFLQEKIRKKLSTKHWIVKIWVPIPIAFYPTSRKYRLLFVSLIMFDFHIWWWLVWYPIKYNIKKWNTFFFFFVKMKNFAWIYPHIKSKLENLYDKHSKQASTWEALINHDQLVRKNYIWIVQISF